MKPTPKSKTTIQETASVPFRKLRAFASTQLARRLVLGLFVAQAVLLVFAIRIGTPPDETNHIRFIEYYANHSLDPMLSDQVPTFNLGDKTREVDYLYHYSMSLVYRVSPLPAEQTYTMIRLLTVLAALLCFIVLANVFRKLGVSEGAVTVGLLVVTNLPMVLMMSSVVNNDVYVWLGLALGLALLLRLWKQPTATDLLWLGSLTVIGGLIKRDLLPFGLVFGIIALVIFVRHTRSILAGLRRFSWHLVAAIVVLLVGVTLFTERIGGNVVRYGSIVVECEQVHGEAACHDFWGNVRARSLERQPKDPMISPVMFAARWAWDSSFNIVDIQTQGWRHEVKPARWLTPALLTLLVVGLGYGAIYEKTRFAAKQLSRWRVYIAAIALYYIAVNMVVNYGTYQSTQVYGIALNGRYIIPSVLVLAVLACFYWSKLLLRRPALLVVLTVFVALATILASGLLMMLRNPQLYHG